VAPHPSVAMLHFSDADQAALLQDALGVLTAVTTTSPGVGRRNVVANLLLELEQSFDQRDPRCPLRWIASQSARESPRHLSNMVYAAAHAVSTHIGKKHPERLGAAVQHFRRVQAHVEHLLGSEEWLHETRALDAALAFVHQLPSRVNLMEGDVVERAAPIILTLVAGDLGATA
jgi:hypothetical protein